MFSLNAGEIAAVAFVALVIAGILWFIARR
jgi:hypothetical protein